LNAPASPEQLALVTSPLPPELLAAFRAAEAAAGVAPAVVGAGVVLASSLGDWIEVRAPGGPFAFMAREDLTKAGRDLFHLVHGRRRA
jgi:hypothetical protein